jgi:hypothetical protein
MLRHFASLLMAAVAGVAMAQASDRPQSAACRDALDDVQAQETRALAARQSPTAASGSEGARVSAGLQAARERAARACLGGSADAPPQRMAQQPVAVTPVTPPAPTSPTSPGTRFTPTPAPAVSVPQRSDVIVTITGCDPAGCWASDGTRLNRVGPNLVGPRGTCTLQGPVVRCP